MFSCRWLLNKNRVVQDNPYANGAFFLVLVVLIGSQLIRTTSLNAQNEDGPVNVGLLYFSATSQSDGVRMDWETASELGTAGFIIQRSSNGSNFVTLDDIGIVFSQGGVATGVMYNEVDKTAVLGQTYTYKLVEIETNSNQHELETVTITYTTEYPVFLPLVIN